MTKRTTDHTVTAGEQVASNNKTKESKPLILIAGDSIITDINGWMLSRTSRVKVHSFSGADTSDMHDFMKPLVKKKSSRIIVNCGTNDLASNQVQNIAMNIKNLENIDRTVSGLTLIRDDGLASKAAQLNTKLRSLLGKGIDFIEHNNVEKGHLNGSRLHLNKRGNGRLAFNFIQYIKNLRAKKQGS